MLVVIGLVMSIAVSGLGPFAFTIHGAGATDYIDDFEDGDISSNPPWAGDTAYWEANSTFSFTGDWGVRTIRTGQADEITASITDQTYDGVSLAIREGGNHGYTGAAHRWHFTDTGTDVHLGVATSDTGDLLYNGSESGDVADYEDTGLDISPDTWYVISYENIDYANDQATLKVFHGNGTLLGQFTVNKAGDLSGLDKVKLYGSGNTAAWADSINDAPYNPPSPDSSSSDYSQTYILDDRSGLFPPDRSTLTVAEWDPGAKSLATPSESTEWSEIDTKPFNAQNETTFQLTDSDYYKLTVTAPTGDTWELVGIQANDSSTRTRLQIFPIQQGTPTPTPTPTRTPGVTPFPTPTPTATPGLTPFPTPTPDTGFGPTALGYCDVPGTDERGLSVEYYDPDRQTTSFNYNLSGPDGDRVYTGTKTFDNEIGYYRGCIAPATLNETDAGQVEGTYNGSLDDGTEFNGSLSFPEPSFGGPIGGGGGGSGGASSATTFGGWLLLAAGGYLAYRRYGNGQIEAALGSVGQQVSNLLGR
jgi:hypothetical protein